MEPPKFIQETLHLDSRYAALHAIPLFFMLIKLCSVMFRLANQTIPNVNIFQTFCHLTHSQEIFCRHTPMIVNGPN